MKKVLFAIFAICLLIGCATTCPPEPPDQEPFYINNSGVAVKLTAINIIMEERVEIDSSYFVPIYTTIEQKIENNDTLCNYYMQGYNCATSNWQIIGGYEGIQMCYTCYEPMYFKIEFLSEPKRCLVFDGNVKVGENDVRYWENYTLSEKGSHHADIHYYYITPELREQAREEYCGE